jgi:hypothetical protein
MLNFGKIEKSESEETKLKQIKLITQMTGRHILILEHLYWIYLKFK